MKSIITPSAIMAVICLALGTQSATAASVLTWDGHNRVNLNWDTSTANWNPGGVAFTNGDTAKFVNHPTALGQQNLVIAPGGVSPAAITMGHWQGEAGSYGFTGGDITGPGTFSMTSDGVLHLPRSFSFSGGVSLSHVGANVQLDPTAGGTYHFGTGNITLSSGWTGNQFRFLPAVAATNDNNFVIASSGGSIQGNANVTWNSQVALQGTVGLDGSQIWSGMTFNLSDNNGNIRLNRGGSNSQFKFDGNVQGPAYDVKFGDKLTGGTPTDYEIVIDPNSTWNVNNLILDSLATVIMVEGTNSQTVFDDVNGKIVLQNNSILSTTTGSTGNYNSYGGTYYVENDYELHSGTFTRIVASSILVQDDGSVSGDGRLHAHGSGVTVNDGTLAPGFSIGTLNVLGNLNLTSDSLLDFELGAPGISDLIAVTGNLTLDGTMNLSLLSNLTPNTFHHYDLLTYTGTLSGSSLDFNLPGNAQAFLDLSTSGVVGVNVIVYVPEPGTLSLLFIGLVALRLKKRDKQAA